MNDILTVDFRLDAAQTVRASMAIQRGGRRSWIAWTTWPMLAGLALMYRIGGVPWSEMGLLFTAAILLAVITFAAPRVQRWQLQRAYRSSPILREPQRYEFSAAGVSIRGGPASSTLTWDAIIEARETDEFFLLFFARKSAYYVPKKALATAASCDALRRQLRNFLGPRASGLRGTASSVAPPNSTLH